MVYKPTQRKVNVVVMAVEAGSPIMQLYHDSSSLFSAMVVERSWRGGSGRWGGGEVGCVLRGAVSSPHAEKETSFSKETVKSLEFRSKKQSKSLHY